MVGEDPVDTPVQFPEQGILRADKTRAGFLAYISMFFKQ
jgi:hypothetical protein